MIIYWFCLLVLLSDKCCQYQDENNSHGSSYCLGTTLQGLALLVLLVLPLGTGAVRRGPPPALQRCVAVLLGKSLRMNS